MEQTKIAEQKNNSLNLANISGKNPSVNYIAKKNRRRKLIFGELKAKMPKFSF
jgi:hypothetical protein